VYVMAAVRIRNVPGARYLAHEIGPGLQYCSKEVFCEPLRYVGWHLSGLDKRRKVERLVRGEHDKGHRLQRSSGRYLSDVLPMGVPLQVRVYGERLFRWITTDRSSEPKVHLLIGQPVAHLVGV
jgi:hypothetical protein